MLIEEVEAFRPARYGTEPVELGNPDWSSLLVESGPRFATVLDLDDLLSRT